MIIPSREEEVIERILEITDSPKSVPFYKYAIRVLGIGLVEEELGELRYLMHTKQIESPARFYTKLITDRIEAQERNLPDKTAKSSQLSNKETSFYTSIDELLDELFSISKVEPNRVPYSNKSIPWPTLVGPEFFTLSTNKALQDSVPLKIRLQGGDYETVTLHRGVMFTGAEPQGILTPEEGRILAAIESFWIGQGQPTDFGKDGKFYCHCLVPIRDLSELIGWKSFNGNGLIHLKQKLLNLKTKGYTIEYRNGDKVLKFPFTFLSEVNPVEVRTSKVSKCLVPVQFSWFYSSQLMRRRIVSRPKSIMTIRGDLAFILRLYLEPILMSTQRDHQHSIELLNLIRTLNLPSAGWHSIKSKRKSVFQVAINEINGMQMFDNRFINIRILQANNPNDFLLKASSTLSYEPFLINNH